MSQVIAANPQTEAVYINFCNGIDPVRAQALMAACAEAIQRFNPRSLYLALSSAGGDVASGIALYNFLRALPVNLITHNIGAIDSIATVIFLAGAERYSVPTGTFLFHGVQLRVAQPTALTIYQIREYISGLEEDHNRIVHIITERTQLTEDEVRGLFEQGESKNPAYAQEKGVINNIRDFAVPQGAPFFSLTV